MTNDIYCIQRRSDEKYLGLRGWTSNVGEARAYFGQQSALRTMGLYQDVILVNKTKAAATVAMSTEEN